MDVILAIAWKMLATAGIIVSAARIAERAGPFSASVLLTLPLNAGPGFVFLSLEHGAPFIADAALVSFATTAATIVYAIAYVRLAARWGLWTCLAGSVLAWLGATAIMLAAGATLLNAFLGIALAAALAFFLRRPFDLFSPPGAIRASWRYLLARGGTAGLVVAGVATAGHVLGPTVSGLLLGFPLILSTTVWTMHRKYGPVFTAATIASTQRSVVIYASFPFALHFLAGPLAPPAAAALALAVSVTVALSLSALVWRARRVAARMG